MASMSLLAELDAERINGGGVIWGKPSRSTYPKSSYNSTTYRSAKTYLAQGNVSNNLALGLGLHGFGTATATSTQSNVAYVNTFA